MPDSKEKEKQISLDILSHVEELSKKVNHMMESRTRSVLRRYPLTFALLVLFGALAVTDGIRGILAELGFENKPWYLLVLGLIILTFTGTLYKKLDRAEE